MDECIPAIHEYDRKQNYKTVADAIRRSPSTKRTVIRNRKLCLLNNAVHEWIQRAVSQENATRVSKLDIQKTAIEVLVRIKIPKFELNLCWLNDFRLNWKITDEDLIPQRVASGSCIEAIGRLSLKIPDIIQYARVNPFLPTLPKPQTVPQADNNSTDDNTSSDEEEFYDLKDEVIDDEPICPKEEPGICIEAMDDLSLKIPDIIDNVRVNLFSQMHPRPQTISQADNTTPSDNTLVLNNKTSGEEEFCDNMIEVGETEAHSNRRHRTIDDENSENCKPIANYEEALKKLLRLENIALLEGNVTAYDLIYQLERNFQKFK